MMFGPREGSWWLSSKNDQRWNASGKSAFVGGFVMCDECKVALEEMKAELGEPPTDLTHGYMKD